MAIHVHTYILRYRETYFTYSNSRVVRRKIKLSVNLILTKIQVYTVLLLFVEVELYKVNRPSSLNRKFRLQLCFTVGR